MPLRSLLRALCSALLFCAFTAPSRAQAPTIAFKLIDTPFTVGPVNGVVFGNGTFVVSTATSASLRVFASLDGLRWQETILRTTSASSINSPVRFANGKFIINDVTVVNNIVTANFRTSSDGITWTNATAGSSPTQIVTAVAGDGTRLLAAGANSFLVNSVNGGGNWTNVPLNPGFGSWHSLAYGDGRWYLAGSFTSGFNTVRRLYTSTDGFQFTLSAVAPDVASVVFGGGRWLLVGQNGSAAYTSTDGVSFSATTFPAGSPFESSLDSVRFVNGRFISLRASGRLLQSTDGVTWTDLAATFPGGLELTGPLDLAYGNGRYVLTTSPVRAGANSLVFSADASVVSTAGRVINLSVLTELTGASDSFTLGYVVGGPGTTGAKPVVLRAVGPSLSALGVISPVADPRLELFAGAAATGQNDNWGGRPELASAMASVGAFALTGPASLDAAVTTALTTRDNSVAVSATGPGKVIAEIYDATPAASFFTATPRLLNVSVLKSLGTSLTVGFTLAGPTSKTVLIRAIGPTLGDFGVPGTVADPQLTLFDSTSTKLAENDNWAATPALAASLSSVFSSVGAFALPLASRDAALLTTLPPGGYSVQVSGANNSTGTALVEVYEVP